MRIEFRVSLRIDRKTPEPVGQVEPPFIHESQGAMVESVPQRDHGVPPVGFTREP